MNKSHFADFFAYIFDPLHRIWSRHAREIPLIRILLHLFNNHHAFLCKYFKLFNNMMSCAKLLNYSEAILTTKLYDKSRVILKIIMSLRQSIKKLNKFFKKEAFFNREKDTSNVDKIAKALGISRMTVYRALKMKNRSKNLKNHETSNLTVLTLTLYVELFTNSTKKRIVYKKDDN